MLSLYKKAFALFLILTTLSLFGGVLSYERAFIREELLPSRSKALSWFAESVSDASADGNSSITVNDKQFNINFDFKLSTMAQYRYVTFTLAFEGEKEKGLADLSRFSSLSFKIRCAPENVVWVGLATFEPGISKPGDYISFRIPSTYVSCNQDWQKVSVDLTRLETPEWWYDKYHIDLSKQNYRLDKVARISFGSSAQSPVDVHSNVRIDELALKGQDMRYVYSYVAMLLLLWGCFIFWFARQHTKTLVNHLTDKLQKDRPLVAYQQLSLEPQRDKDKNTILRFMATEYADPELNLETTVSKVGVSRTKINEILKQELGFTFSAYLNKLRLTEAARLLSEEGEVNVAEIAYSVGYRNVSYFNKLFKNEYGCTPRTFKKTYESGNNN